MQSSGVFLESPLGSDARIKILRTLFQEAFPLLDAEALARETGRSRAGVHLALGELLSSQVLVAHVQGRTRLFAVNRDHRWFGALFQLFRDERLRDGVSHLFPTFWNHLEPVVDRISRIRGVLAVVLFGSVTRPPLYPDADVDLLVVAPKAFVRPLGRNAVMGHNVSLLVMTPEALGKKVATGDEFVRSALERHVVLHVASRYRLPWLLPPPSRMNRFRGRGARQ